MSIVRLGDICQFINGGAWTQSEFSDYGYPVLKVSNCKPSGFVIDDVSFIPLDIAEKSEINKLHIHDVIIATVGSHPNLVDSAAGRSCVVTNEVDGYYLNQNAVCLRTLDRNVLNQRYLGFLTQYFPFQHYIQNRGKGAANQMRIAISAIKEYTFDLPNIEIQDKIANILSAYDDLIENNQKQIKLLEEAIQRLYKEWFVDLRFPGHETTPLVDGVPEGWKSTAFSEVFDFVRGKSYTSKELSDTDGMLMVNLKNIRAFGGYKRNAEKRFLGTCKENQLVDGGDVVMGVTDMTQERRLVGHVALVPTFNEKATFSMDLIKLVPYSVSKNYLYSSLRYGGYSNQIAPLANGVNVLHLKPEAIMKMEMLVPNEDIMQSFDKLFESIRLKIEALEKECDLAAQARDRLLPKLMSGELEV